MWSPFAHAQPTPEEQAEQARVHAAAEQAAREERIDQRIKAAVAAGLAEPSFSETIREKAAARSARLSRADRLFGMREESE